MTSVDILRQLVAFPSVVGRPNGDIVGWIAAYAERQGAAVTVLPGPEGDRSNLLITIGPRDVPGYLLSGHMDVVPADEDGWSSDPFRLRQDGERLYGRGACDMKGFLAAALAVLPGLAGRRLARPLHLAFTYDEEAGCRGAPHLLDRLPHLCAPPLGCIIGEPSGLAPVLAHKGKAAARLTIRGRAGHSSRPDLALNAIHAMAGVLQAAVREAASLRDGQSDDRFEPPYSSLQVGLVKGGSAVNIVPELCFAEIEARAIAGIDPAALLEPIRRRAAALEGDGFSADWALEASYPALALDAGSSLARLVEDLSGRPPLAAVSYGTEAGLYQAAGLPAVICGPGDIARAHRPDEYIEHGELQACRRMIERLAERLF